MKSHFVQEQFTNVIDLDNDEPIPVEMMLKYFYTGKYNEPVNETKEPRPHLQIQVQTYILADKYDVPTLMGLIEKKFRSTLGKGLAPEEYLSVVSNVYTIPTPANTLRVIVAEYARTRIRDMMQSAHLDVLRATLHDVPEFAFDIIQLFANDTLIGHCHSCGPNQGAEALQARCKTCGKGGISLTHY